jgi:hypothetical protein
MCFKAKLLIKCKDANISARHLKFNGFDTAGAAKFLNLHKSLTTNSFSSVRPINVKVGDGGLATAKLEIESEGQKQISYCFATAKDEPRAAKASIFQQPRQTRRDRFTIERYTVESVVRSYGFQKLCGISSSRGFDSHILQIEMG